MNQSAIFRSKSVLVFLLFFLIPVSASAHLATFGSWETTEKYLKELFPNASSFRIKKHTFSETTVKQIEKQLGFQLYPEDKTPSFYLAMNGKNLLGVALFIDPRIEEKFVRLEVGIGVDRKGRIKRVRLFEYRGDPNLNSDKFLKQFVGKRHDDSFKIEKDGKLEPVPELELESQLVADAAREALLLMRLSLTKKTK